MKKYIAIIGTMTALTVASIFLVGCETTVKTNTANVAYSTPASNASVLTNANTTASNQVAAVNTNTGNSNSNRQMDDSDKGMEMIHNGMDMVKSGNVMIDKAQNSKDKPMMSVIAP